ncbi:MAG TPA: PKD domain-containing protein [Bacteroidia bacterium]|nr:PKD domain-containing protein [Bacteroidia bacterium]
MKNLKTILILAALLPLQVKSQTCSGDYQWLVNGLGVSFYGNTTPDITNVIWDFGDGNWDNTNSLNTSHTYAAPGIYHACIQYYNTAQGCGDSTCHTIVIDSCYGSMNYSVNGLTVQFTGSASAGGPNTVYAWDFGDSNSSYAQNPSHTYASAGTYTVCFAFYDSSSGCADSVCEPVSVGGGCYAQFTSVDSMGYAFFVNQSSPGSAGMYVWYFGDGGYSTAYNPSYQYSYPGTYQVCLEAFDSLQNFCDSTCHYITVNNVSSVNEETIVRNSLLLSPNPADEDLRISWNQAADADVQIAVLDLAGRTVITPVMVRGGRGVNTKEISTRGLAAGMYMLRIDAGNQTGNSPLVVTHKE